MLAIISPAKRLKFSPKPFTDKFTLPENLDYSEKIINELRKLSPKQLQKFMNINTKLAEENFQRFIEWRREFTLENARQAILSFSGDVFLGMDASSFSSRQLDFAQNHLRILSGLYGALRPLDLIMPYRLEMGHLLKIAGNKNLYDYWKSVIPAQIEKALESSGNNVLINLASQEYFKSVRLETMSNIRVITPDFREFKDGSYKFVHVLGKKARGLMCKFIIQNEINDPEKLKFFELEGYEYNDPLSAENQWVFTRG